MKFLLPLLICSVAAAPGEWAEPQPAEWAGPQPAEWAGPPANVEYGPWISQNSYER